MNGCESKYGRKTMSPLALILIGETRSIYIYGEAVPIPVHLCDVPTLHTQIMRQQDRASDYPGFIPDLALEADLG